MPWKLPSIKEACILGVKDAGVQNKIGILYTIDTEQEAPQCTIGHMLNILAPERMQQVIRKAKRESSDDGEYMWGDYANRLTYDEVRLLTGLNQAELAEIWVTNDNRRDDGWPIPNPNPNERLSRILTVLETIPMKGD